MRIFFSSRKSWTLPYLIFSAVFVIIPLILILVYAFTDDAGHLTLENFRKFFAHPEAVNTFVYSIGIAILTTIGCILLGYPAAWILSQSKMSYSRTLILLFILPMWVNILIRTLATVALFDFLRFFSFLFVKRRISSDIYAGNKCKVITFLQKSDVFQATSLRVRRLAKNRRTSSPLTRKAVTAIHTMRTTEGVPSGSRAAKRSYPICTKTKWQR